MAVNLDGMNPEFRARLLAMVNASGGKLTINSGYRSVQEQTALWNAAVAKYGPQEARKWVAPPGSSNHNKGIAADLGGDLGWAHAHAAEFGLYFPMEWEPWHTELTGSRTGQFAGSTVPPASMQPPRKQNTISDGLQIVASLMPGATEGQSPDVAQGAAPSVEPTSPSEAPTAPTGETMDASQPWDQQKPPTAEEEDTSTSLPASAPGGGANDVMSQLRDGFLSVGRKDLADMVGTPEFGAWINMESGWDPQSVSPANNQGKANGGLFQFWFGHSWAAPYNQNGVFTMSPFQQAQMAATKFNLTPERIRQFAAQIQNHTYRGWG